MSIGRNQDPAQFGPQPANVHIERYIPQTLLFPYCDLVIASGSYNTLISALAHGLFLLVIPISDTQPLHARRCAELGVGRILRRQSQFAKELQEQSRVLSPQTLRETVFELLQNDRYAARAGQMRREIGSLPDADSTVPLLEKLVLEKPLAARKRPVEASSKTGF
jgi:UDP:flavonoid glycosyltransferase YjiC (YdhE family)